jgi:CheY-like chemotaxis protein
MPGMDGGELSGLMRQRLGPTCPKILLLTSRGFSSEDVNGHITARLVKPVKPRELFATMIHALGAQGSALDVPVRPVAATLNRELASQQPMRILVAEDNAINQKVLLHILKRFGYEADAVGNGRIALEFLERQSYDLVIMDMQMPEMDGLEATRIFRRRVPKSEPPYILALTASALMEDYQACMEAGMHAFLSKPVRPDDLVEALLQAWSWLRAARTVGEPA